jgi:hypothetical protein
MSGAEGRSRSRGREDGTRTPKQDVPSGFNLEEFAKALKPFLAEVMDERLGKRLDDMNENLTKRCDSMEARIAKVEGLEPRVQELERKIAETAASCSTSSLTSEDFVPKYVEIKGYCSWEERREKGLTRDKAGRLVAELRGHLPEELRGHFGEMQLRNMFNHKIQVSCTPKFTREIRGCLAEILQKGDIKVNDAILRVTAERPVKEQVRFQKFGRLMDAVKQLLKDKPDLKLEMEIPTCTVYIHKAMEERAVMVAEVSRDNETKVDEKVCESYLGITKEDLLTAASR